MRRGLASLITGLSLLLATVSWAGFTMSRTVLDPGRSEALAEQLLDNPQVREALVSRLADSVESQLPAEVPVSRGVIESGAAVAIDDPRIRALILDGVVRYHRNALEGNTEPVVIDANALGQATRDALVGVRPELDTFLPATPSVQLELPTTGLSWLATLKRVVDQFTTLAAILALAGATTALVVARDRGAVLRRVAFWGYGAAAFWLIVGYAVPWVGELLSPTSGAIASAAVDVFFGAMIRPAVILAIASTVLLVVGYAVPTVGRQRGSRILQPSRPRPAGAPVAGHPPGRGAGQPPPAAAPPLVRPQPTRVVPPTAPSVARPVAPPSVSPTATPMPPVDRTMQMPRPGLDTVAPPTPTPNPAPSPAPDQRSTEHVEAPAWEEGVGYIDDERPPGRGNDATRAF